MGHARSEVLRCQYDWAVWALVTVLVAVVLWVGWAMFAVPTAPNAQLIIQAYQQYVAPKPQERFVVLCLLALVPIGMVAWYRCSRMPGRALAWLPVALACLCAVPWLGGEFAATVLGQYPKLAIGGYAWLALAAVLAVGLCLRASFARSESRTWAWALFLVLVALQLLAWRIVSFSDVTRSHVFTTHMDPVFYALSQVVGGKTLLVDLPSQYGLFPEFIGPFARYTGLSVGGVSALFAVMQVASLAALYLVVQRVVGSAMIRVLTGATLVLITYESVLFFVGIDERYYQYWPIRFFWPALSVLAFYWVTRAPSLLRSVPFSVLSGLALLWNFDSGLFVGLAFGAWLFCQAVFANRGDRLRWCVWLGAHVAIVAVVVGAFLVYLSYKSGAHVSIGSLFLYQKIFFDLGLMMMPLPSGISMWPVILGVYGLGLCCSLRRYAQGDAGSVSGLVLYLSVLGAGLFVYYAGRSHVLNLVTVAWPAVLVGAVLSDRLLRMRDMGHAAKAPAYVFVFATIVMAGSLAWHVPMMVKSGYEWIVSRTIVKEPFVSDELDLIKKYSAGRTECAILSQRQGIYFAQAGLASAIKGPGIVEALLVEDVNRMMAALDAGVPCLFVGVGGNSDPGLKLDMPGLYERYKSIAKTPDGSMLYFEPR